MILSLLLYVYFTDRRVERSQVRPERGFADSCPDNPASINVNTDFHRPNVPENKASSFIGNH